MVCGGSPAPTLCPAAAREAQERAKTATQQQQGDQPGPSGTCEAPTSKRKGGGKGGPGGSLAKAKKGGVAARGGKGGGKGKLPLKGTKSGRRGGKGGGKKGGRGPARGADPKGKRPVGGDESWDESEEDGGGSSSSEEEEGREGADPDFDAAAGEVSRTSRLALPRVQGVVTGEVWLGWVRWR